MHRGLKLPDTSKFFIFSFSARYLCPYIDPIFALKIYFFTEFSRRNFGFQVSAKDTWRYIIGINILKIYLLL